MGGRMNIRLNLLKDAQKNLANNYMGNTARTIHVNSFSSKCIAKIISETIEFLGFNKLIKNHLHPWTQ